MGVRATVEIPQLLDGSFICIQHPSIQIIRGRKCSVFAVPAQEPVFLTLYELREAYYSLWFWHKAYWKFVILKGWVETLAGASSLWHDQQNLFWQLPQLEVVHRNQYPALLGSSRGDSVDSSSAWCPLLRRYGGLLAATWNLTLIGWLVWEI